MNRKKILGLGIALIIFIFNNLLVSSILFIFKVTISKWNIILSLIISVLEYILYMKKNKYTYKCIIISIITFLMIICTSTFISSKLYDNSWDGASYHKTAVGLLKNGWNPVYESAEDFNVLEKNKVTLTEPHDKWLNHYAKGYWIYAANTYALTNNIESGKSILIITAIATFLILYSLLNEKIRRLYSIIIAFLLALNPVLIYQIYTFYNDGLLGNFVIILSILLISIFSSKSNELKKEKWLLYFLVLCILINIKFTGFAYAGIYSFVFYIYAIFNKEKRKEILKPMTITAIVSLVVAIGIIGYSSYVKNTLEHKHPFYPLYGEGKVDIMSAVTPKGFENYNQIEKFLIANFYGYNPDGGLIYKSKIPFTFSVGELKSYYYSDVTIGGYGVMFGGILILSIIAGIYILVIAINKRINITNYLLVIIGTFLIIILMKESWWARYFPQFYLMPFIVILLLIEIDNKKLTNYIVNLIIVFLLINTYLIINPVMQGVKYQCNIINKQNDYLKSIPEDKNIKIVTSSKYSKNPMFDGLVYNVYDIHKNVEVIEYTDEIKNYEKYEYFGDSPLINIYIEK